MLERQSWLRRSLTAMALLACAAWSHATAATPRDPSPRSNREATASRSKEKKQTKAERRAEAKRNQERGETKGGAVTPAPADPPASAAPSSAGEEPSPEAQTPPVTVPDATLVPAELEAEPLDAEPLESDSLEPESLEAENRDNAAPADAGTGDSTEAASLLAESLAAYESAHSSWDRGLIDEAFAALDRAYELMAAVDAEGDPLRAQEKEDLRRLISRRVVEIYASRPTAAGDLEGSIPFEMNEHVQREILSFSGPERQFFMESYVRGGQYRPMILKELRAAGMPLELAWMPIVESGFKVRAYSVARALGLWQFIPSTGYRFGLERNNWIDERMDPEKSTKAAIAYLTELHGLFGDWLTALAAYNCGEHLVLRLLSAQPVSYFDHFWDLYLRLPRETRRYVPRFLAVRAILEDPAAYGFVLPEPMFPLEFDVVRTERTADLGELERRLQLADGTIKNLNPELRRNATPGDPYDVKIPRGMVETVAATITQLPARVLTAEAAPPSSGGGTTHRVRHGETLARIATRYGTSVQALVKLNGLRSANRIFPGQSLRVRAGGGSSDGGGSVAVSTVASGDGRTHRVGRGDNLWVIAKRYGTTVDRIKRDNGLHSNLLQVGQKLVISSSRATTGAG